MANCTDSIVVDLTPQDVQVNMWQSPDYVIGLKSYTYNLQFEAAGMGPPGPQGAPGADSTVPGPAGAPGSQGLPGPPGIAATITAGSTATLSPGSAATVSNIGTSSAAVFNFGIPSGLTGATGATGNTGAQGNPGPPLKPKGNVASWSNLPSSGQQAGDLWTTNDTGHGWAWSGTAWIDLGQWQGVTGATGPTGTAATIAAGTTNTLVPGSNATVSNVGTSSAAVFNFGIPAGFAGATGAAGSPGAAATIAVGTTNTGAAGSNAAVTNSGSSSAAVFNFTIPQGVAGANGTPGAPGTAGANSWTLTTAQFTVPPVNSTVVVNVADTSWAVVGEYVWVATAGGSANSPMALQITAKTGTSVTLLNPPTGTNQVSGDANNLVTLGSDSLVYLPPSAIQPTIWSQTRRMWNAVGNPSFEVDQRNVFGAVANILNAFGQDRWQAQSTGTMRANYQAFQGQTNAIVPGTSFLVSQAQANMQVATVQASLGAGDFWQLFQAVEGPSWRELSQDVTSITILCSSSIANHKFAVALRSASSAQSLVKLCTLGAANTWTLITLPNIPKPTSGTFVTTPGSVGYTLSICLAAGTTFTAPALDTWQSGNFIGASGMTNFFATAGANFIVAFIQHEPGSQCTTLIDKPFSQNYDECLRYYCKSYPYATAAGATGLVGSWATFVADTTSTADGPIFFPKPMAKTPTSVQPYNISTGTANSAYNLGAGTSAAITSVGYLSERGFSRLNSSAAFTVNSLYGVHYTADTGM